MKETPGIGKMRTFALVETNVPKIEYGSGRVGAGFLDTYYPLKTIRGYFKSFMGRRTTTAGQVTFTRMYKFITRFDVDVNNAIGKQMRMNIKQKLYTVDNFDMFEEDKQTYIEFTLNQFSK